jgi:hypothetical protein
VTTETPALSDEEFLARFGDTIDDRIAEILDELLDERNLAHRHPRLRALTSLVLAALVACVAAAWIIQAAG